MELVAGSLFGLAFGDALGKPTEFLTVQEITRRYGQGGPRALDGSPALVTDDTQMAIAVAEALTTAVAAGSPTAASRVLSADASPPVLTAVTGVSPAEGSRLALTPAGVEPLLRRRFIEWAHSPDNNRAPGNTCLRAVGGLAEGLPWQRASVAGSKGCGANMRVTPVGLLAGIDDESLANLAQLQAGLTHGHPTALAASELTAYAVAVLVRGSTLTDLPRLLRDRARSQRTVYRGDWLGDLWQRPGATTPAEFIAGGWDDCLVALDRLDAALRTGDRDTDPCLLTGAGWIAEEALATALYCALSYADDPVSALARAATTAGDSDSIGCLAGAFLGAAYGTGAWPTPWYDQIEYAAQLSRLAVCLAANR